MTACPVCSQENPTGARFCSNCGTRLDAVAGPPRETRKVVTVLFSDVAGSTRLGGRLDPETLRRVMSRYFDEMKAALEAHGGTVEKFIGDAVMAVFGIPVTHEDDALRAVRAALEMRGRLDGLNLELQAERGVGIVTRTGINTGEVVAGDPATGQTLATGDPVNVAARLEQAAPPGEILLGEATYRLLRDAVGAEPLEPMSVKGKDEPVQAYRLVEVLPGAEAVRRRLDSPMVGRDRQLSLLNDTFRAAVDDRVCHLFTVIGSPGVGKSRLVHEFVASVTGEASVLRGRCLPYGDGITYWPVAEMVREAAAITDEDTGDVAASKIAATVPDEERDALAERLVQAIGLAEAFAPAEEIAWAFRKLLEAHAVHRPVVAVFDDIHWAEPTLLDLIDHVADWSRDAPILLLTIARQELLDVRSAWGGGKRNATTIQLEPLTEKDCEILVENLLGMALLPEDAKARIAEAAEGNPLFVEQVLSMLIDEELLRPEDGQWVPTADLATIPIPPTIHALLAARLDRLGDEERQVIERASVIGKIFYQGAVSELAPESLRPQIGSHLMSLVRKEFVRTDLADFARGRAFRFRHILIRDAAYGGMPKELRADLHEAFAGWLAGTAGERLTEYEEILGYHLEQAYRYREELGPVDDRARAVAERAAQHLAAAGRRAFNRADLSAAEGLLRRSVELLPSDDPDRGDLLLELAEVLIDVGEFLRVDPVVAEAIALARRQGDRALELQAELLQINRTDSAVAWDERGRVADRALPVFAELGDDRGLYQVHWTRGAVEWTHGRSAAAELELETLMEVGRRLGSTRRVASIIQWRTGTLVWGPTPALRGLEICDELVSQTEGSHFAEGSIFTARVVLEAMLGRSDASRAAAEKAKVLFDDLGSSVVRTMSFAARVGLALEILGEWEEAEEVMRPAMEALHAAGEKGFLSTLAPSLGLIVARMGRLDEAEELARLGRETSPPDDLSSQISWRDALAVVMAGRNRLEEAERLAREAVALTEGSDYLQQIGTAWRLLGEVLELRGRKDQAIAALDRALASYEAKGDAVDAARTREHLASLQAGS